MIESGLELVANLMHQFFFVFIIYELIKVI